MIQIVFKNLEKSELAREAVVLRLDALREKFPDLKNSKINVILEMENSPQQAGPDLFTVKVHIPSGRYRGVVVKRSDPNLYCALAEVAEHMLERLNRLGDRARVRKRTQARHVLKQMKISVHH